MLRTRTSDSPHTWMLPLSFLQATVLALVGLGACGGKGSSNADADEMRRDSPAREQAADAPSSGDSRGGMDTSVVRTSDVSISLVGRDAGSRDLLGRERSRLATDPPDGGMPGCIWRLMRECCGGPGERCSVQNTDGGTTYLCWPTGELEISLNLGVTITGYRSDGTVCYTQVPVTVNGTDPGMAFHDGNGLQVAVCRYLNNSSTVEVFCDGRSYIAEMPFSCYVAVGSCRYGTCGS